jgi:hypothetical protein
VSSPYDRWRAAHATFDDAWAACDRLDRLVRLVAERAPPAHQRTLFVAAHRSLVRLRSPWAKLARFWLWPFPTEDDVLDALAADYVSVARTLVDSIGGFAMLIGFVVGGVAYALHRRWLVWQVTVVGGVVPLALAIFTLRRLKRLVDETPYSRALELLADRLDAICATARRDAVARELARAKVELRRFVPSNQPSRRSA